MHARIQADDLRKGIRQGQTRSTVKLRHFPVVEGLQPRTPHPIKAHPMVEVLRTAARFLASFCTKEETTGHGEWENSWT